MYRQNKTWLVFVGKDPLPLRVAANVCRQGGGIFMTDLTEAQLRALHALGRMSNGMAAFLNIIDADQLVSLGFAEKIGKGQFILTEKGRTTIEKEKLQ